jgi:hypothetical protein
VDIAATKDEVVGITIRRDAHFRFDCCEPCLGDDTAVFSRLLTVVAVHTILPFSPAPSRRSSYHVLVTAVLSCSTIVAVTAIQTIAAVFSCNTSTYLDGLVSPTVP